MMHCSACGTVLPDPQARECASCGAVQFDDAKPCAGAAVVWDGRLLLVRRGHDPWKGHWDVPGGFCDGAEHPAATAVREVAEETGLSIEVTGFLGMWLDRYLDLNGRVKTTLNIYYHAVLCADAPLSRGFHSDEVQELGWFAPSKIPSREELAFPDHLVPMLAAWQSAVRAGATQTPMWDVDQETPTPT